MTNYERIKNMTKKELAQEIRLIANWDKKEVSKANKIENFFEDYLDKEVGVEDIWDKKIQVELTLKELEDITIALRMVNKAFSGDVRSDLEEKLTDVAHIAKMSV